MAFWSKSKTSDNNRINIDEYFIEWTQNESEKSIYDKSIIKLINESYEKQLAELCSEQRSVFINKTFSKEIKIMGVNESFFTIPGVSHFLNIQSELYKTYPSILAELTLASLKKFGYLCAKKFYEIVDLKFQDFDIQDRVIQRYIQIISTELINGYENIIKKSTVFTNETVNEDLINEFLDLGLNDSYYFARILKEATELTLSMIGYKNEFGQEHTFAHTINDESSFADADDFIEKTQTMYMNNSVDNALKIFGIDETAGPSELKQAYRKLAKKYHPDINRSPDAHVIMQNINIHKAILDEYFEN